MASMEERHSSHAGSSPVLRSNLSERVQRWRDELSRRGFADLFEGKEADDGTQDDFSHRRLEQDLQGRCGKT